jgi:phosphoribosylformimino-5-aminoimidazole carboxamide ribotide isomerase
MELYPAIDVRGGDAVRLTQGDFERETRYGDPVQLARQFIAGGATWLHVVDLEAARTGTTHELPILEEITQLTSERVRVQTGGGVRTEHVVEAALGRGVSRVVMGTAALKNPALASRCARRWPGQVAIGLDYVLRDDGVAEAQGHGWLRGSERSLPELLANWEGEPFGAVVATSIARDGMLDGPDFDGMRSLLESTALPVIASGGVGSLADIASLAALSVDGRQLAGVIVGKALVEGRFGVEEAMAACVPSV